MHHAPGLRFLAAEAGLPALPPLEVAIALAPGRPGAIVERLREEIVQALTEPASAPLQGPRLSAPEPRKA